MASVSDTLFVKRLPVSLSKVEIEDFLKHIGATNVRVFDSKVKKQTAIAKFKSGDVAREVLFRLHQQMLFGSRLVVEYAQNCDCKDDKGVAEVEKQTEQKRLELQREFVQRLNNWTVGLNFTLPPPCHLNYRYPSPTAEPLLNIVNMLTYNTKFYTQVLHLMNKMNLPCPFEDSFPLQSNEVFNSFVLYILQNSVYEDELSKELKQSSEEGSELESENEDTKTVSAKSSRKRLASNTNVVKKRRIFKGLTVPTRPEGHAKSTSKTSMDVIFDKVDFEPVKKIEVKMPSEIPVPESEPMVEETGGFGMINPPEKPNLSQPLVEKENDDTENSISSEELSKNRLRERDRKILPVFKNYDSGLPSCRLYIKNLAKNVTIDDLRFIYNRYFIKGIDEQGLMFDIRLMQEGKMKGQAFITLQSVKQAELALKETNGFILKNKPMVVQFARSAVAK